MPEYSYNWEKDWFRDMRIIQKKFWQLIAIPLYFIAGCNSFKDPDDGLKFKFSLEDISVTTLKYNGYHELVKGSGGYTKGIGDTIIVYEFDQGMPIRRHAIFKYHGDTTAYRLSKYISKLGFSGIKLITKSNRKIFIATEEKYKKQYYVTLSENNGLHFSYPDTTN